MKASRAPGPLSYAQQHTRRGTSTTSAAGSGSSKTGGKSSNSGSAVENGGGGVVRRMIDLDAIPDFEDVNAWGTTPSAITTNSAPSASHIAPIVMTAPVDPYDPYSRRPVATVTKNVSSNGPSIHDLDAYASRLKDAMSKNSYEQDELDDYVEGYYGNMPTHGQRSVSQPANHKPNARAGPPHSINRQTISSAPAHTTAPIDDDDDEEDNIDYMELVRRAQSATISPRATGSAPVSSRREVDSDDESHSPSPYPVRRQPSSKVASAAPTKSSSVKPQPVSNAPVPLLPCEESPKPMSEQDKLYYGRQPRRVEFKPYTLEQYKQIKPKEYVEIGKMKPDLNTEELIAKRRNAERVKEFSRQLRNVNKEVISQAPKLPAAQEQLDMEIARKKRESNRERALEFSKYVPKPTVAESTAEIASSERARSASRSRIPVTTRSSVSSKAVSHPATNVSGIYMSEDDVNAARLQELEAKHASNKARMDAIRRTIDRPTR